MDHPRFTLSSITNYRLVYRLNALISLNVLTLILVKSGSEDSGKPLQTSTHPWSAVRSLRSPAAASLKMYPRPKRWYSSLQSTSQCKLILKQA